MIIKYFITVYLLTPDEDDNIILLLSIFLHPTKTFCRKRLCFIGPNCVSSYISLDLFCFVSSSCSLIPSFTECIERDLSPPPHHHHLPLPLFFFHHHLLLLFLLLSSSSSLSLSLYMFMPLSVSLVCLSTPHPSLFFLSSFSFRPSWQWFEERLAIISHSKPSWECRNQCGYLYLEFPCSLLACVVDLSGSPFVH